MLNKKKRTVCVINAGRKNKTTNMLLEKIIKKPLFEDVSFKMIHLSKYDIKPCTGCENCLRRDNCNIDDDVNMLIKDIMEADGIIIASPVYMNGVSGKLKILFDRTCKWMHRPVLFSKPILDVVTTAASGARATLKYMDDVSHQWGANPAGGIYRTVKTYKKDISDREIIKFKRLLYQEKDSFRPSYRQLLMFNVQKVLAYNVLDIDKEYWNKKEWFENDFYYPCKVNIIKKLVFKMFFRFLNSRVSKNSR